MANAVDLSVSVVAVGHNPGAGEDRYGLPVTTSSERALDAYCEALDLALAQRDGARRLLSEALQADESCALAWALLGLQQRATGDISGGNESLTRAFGLASGLTDRERSHLDVLHRFALAPDKTEAAIQKHLSVWPGDALIVLQADYFYNFVDSRSDRYPRQLALFEQVVRAYEDDWFMLGELAFAAEENGYYSRARELAEHSLAENQMNALAAHSLAHVFLETGDVEEGTSWLQTWLASWDRPSTFGCHLRWHLALFRLVVGDMADVTALLAEVIAYGGGSPRALTALTDGASLAWRLKLDGYDGDLPWDELLTLADRPGFTLDNAHHALALAGMGDTAGLASYGDQLARWAASGHPTARDCSEFTQALGYLVAGAPGPSADLLTGLLPRFRNFGGSHAQTEVFEDTTIAALHTAGRGEEAATLVQARLARRMSGRDVRWLGRLEAELSR